MYLDDMICMFIIDNLREISYYFNVEQNTVLTYAKVSDTPTFINLEDRDSETPWIYEGFKLIGLL